MFIDQDGQTTFHAPQEMVAETTFRSSGARRSFSGAINISPLCGEGRIAAPGALQLQGCPLLQTIHLLVPPKEVGSVSLPRNSICSDERPTNTLNSPGSARHCFALRS